MAGTDAQNNSPENSTNTQSNLGNSVSNQTNPDYITERVRYFDGQFLQSKDFNDEQNYHIKRQSLANRLLRVSGICEGLEIQMNNEQTQITINPGVAMTVCGQFVILKESQCITLAHAPTTSQIDLYLYAEEKASDKTEKQTDYDFTTQNIEEKGTTRWQEKASIVVVNTGETVIIQSKDVEVRENIAFNIHQQYAQIGIVTISASPDANPPTIDHKYAGIYLPSSTQKYPITRIAQQIREKSNQAIPTENAVINYIDAIAPRVSKKCKDTKNGDLNTEIIIPALPQDFTIPITLLRRENLTIRSQANQVITVLSLNPSISLNISVLDENSTMVTVKKENYPKYDDEVDSSPIQQISKTLSDMVNSEPGVQTTTHLAALGRQRRTWYRPEITWYCREGKIERYTLSWHLTSAYETKIKNELDLAGIEYIQKVKIELAREYGGFIAYYQGSKTRGETTTNERTIYLSQTKDYLTREENYAPPSVEVKAGKYFPCLIYIPSQETPPLAANP